MSSARYNQIVQQIENAQDEEELNAARAAVSAYKAQKGGVNVELQLEIYALSDKINVRLNQLNNY